MPKTTKTTIKEAFNQHNKIIVDVIFEEYCKFCKTLTRYIDEEISFEGNFDEFKDKYYNRYNYPDFLEFDTEVEHIEGNRYEYNPPHHYDERIYCDECESDYSKALYDAYDVED